MRVAQVVRRSGISSTKLTGGDPALYGPLEEGVFRLKADAQMHNVEVISRHPRIGVRAPGLADAGVTLFNLSVDTMNAEIHQEICGVDDLDAVLNALEECVATGVPCKVNTVVMAGVNDHELPDLIAHCERVGVRSLKLLDVIKDLDLGTESFVRRLAVKRGARLRDLYRPLSEVVRDLDLRARDVRIEQQGGLGHPMTILSLESGLELIVKDSNQGAWYGTVCKGCPFFPCHDALMAIRLTADLRIQFCLLREDISIDLAPLIADGRGLERAINEALSVYDSAHFHADSGAPLLSDVSMSTMGIDAQ